MKITESLFKRSNYDQKNITNKGSQIVPRQALEKIESEGVTLEFLQSLNVPVFKYRSQITIHGLFPSLENSYIGGYKNLFQNKNLSIGVKWHAVDFAKKDRIYKTVRNFLDGWFIRHNSTDFYLEKTSSPLSKGEVKTYLEKEKKEMAKIDTTLFFGNSGMWLGEYFGQYFVISYINVGAILESNVMPCIENITGASIKEIENKEEEIEKKKQEERKAIETKLAFIEEQKALLMNNARQILISENYILVKKVEIKPDKIYIQIGTDTTNNRFNFVAKKFSKEPRQKKWRVEEAESETLDFAFSDKSYDKKETVQTLITAWI